MHPLPQHMSPKIQSTWIVWRSACDQTPQYSLQFQAPAQFQMFFDRQAGHEPVCTDENHAVIIPQSKVGQRKGAIIPSDHNNKHFLRAQVQLQFWARHFNSHSNQHQLQGSTF